MNKYLKILIVAIISLVIIFTAIAIAYKIYNDNNVNEEITGDKNDEIENITEQASSAEIKLSPNAKYIVEYKYEKCGHTIKKEEILPDELVNRNQEEIEELYKDYELKSFSKDKLVILKKVSGNCNEHYKIKEEDGVIVVYNSNENGEEVLYEKTGISTEYLTETDISNITNGLEIYGTENLNMFLEDFE